MSRGTWTAALIAALRDPDVAPVYLVKLEFDSGTEYLHSGLGNLSFGGNTYIGAGSMAQLGVIEEGAELSPYSIELGLSGVDQNILGIAMAEAYFMRLVTVYIGVLDTSGQLVADPGEFFYGYIMNMDISLGDPEQGDAVMLSCESEAAVIERSPRVRYTEATLQGEFAGDLGLQYVDQVVDARPQWRGNEQSTIGSGGPLNNRLGGNGGEGGRFNWR